MPECVLTSREVGWQDWAKQFARARPGRHYVRFPRHDANHVITQQGILNAYRQAAQRAAGGTLIISAGHGGSSGLAKGMVDLGPKESVRLTAAHLKLHEQGRLQRRDQAVVNTTIAIGRIIRQRRIRKVLFLSCNVGNSLEFLGLIASVWGGCLVGGYRHDVEIGFWTEGKGKNKNTTYYIFLKPKPPKTNAEMDTCSVNYPPLKPGDYWSTNRRVQRLRARRAGVPPPPPPRPRAGQH